MDWIGETPRDLFLAPAQDPRRSIRKSHVMSMAFILRIAQMGMSKKDYKITNRRKKAASITKERLYILKVLEVSRMSIPSLQFLFALFCRSRIYLS